jgi:hypothetical protein
MCKNTSEIKHRLKNLTATKVNMNPIKMWKLQHYTPLNAAEIKILAAALRWFGAQTNRWSVISKLFLPHRSAQVVELEYSNIIGDQKKASYFASLILSMHKPEEYM